MKQKFVTNLFLLIFLNLLVKPFWIFGIDRTVQNVVGASEYGLYFSLMNFSMLLNILLDLGLTNFNNRNISQNAHLLSKHLSNLVSLKFLLGIVYILISFVIAGVLGYDSRQFFILFFLIINQFLISFTQYLRSNLAGLQYFKTDSFISVLDRTIMIVFCSLLLWGNFTQTNFKIEWFIFTQTAAYFSTALITFFIVLAKTSHFRFQFDLRFFLAILKRSYPYALLILLMAFYNRIDSVMLERILPDGKFQAGIYAQGYRVLDAAAMFAFLFASLLLPMFSRMIKFKENVGQLVKFSFILLIVPAFLLAAACFFFRTNIMDLLYHNHTTESSAIFGVLMIGFVAISTTYIFGTLLTANGSLRSLNLMASIGMVLNIVSNFIFIPKYGALGAAVVSLTTQFITAGIQVWLAFHIFHFRIHINLAVKLLAYIVFIIALGYSLSLFQTHWLSRFAVFIVFGMGLAVATKIIPLREMASILFKQR